MYLTAADGADTRRWLPQVGEYITSKGGAVTAEQLAPYLDVKTADLERVDGQVNEDFVVKPSAWSHIHKGIFRKAMAHGADDSFSHLCLVAHMRVAHY